MSNYFRIANYIVLQANHSTNTTLVMTSSTRTCNLLTEFLSTMDEDASPGSRGRKMMMRKLKLYLWWKSNLAERKQSGKGPVALLDSSNRINNLFSEEGAGETTAALKKKDQERAQRTQSRRRMRGGAPAAASGSGTHSEPPVVPKAEPKEYALREVQSEADNFARLCVLPFR